MANLSFGPDGFDRNGHSMDFDDNGHAYTTQFGYMGPIFSWWTASTADYANITKNGGVMNLRNYGMGRGSRRGSYQALFHGGFFQKHSLEGKLVGTWTEARIWVYGEPAIASHSNQTVDLDIVQYHYSSNWATTPLATIDSSIDPDRGARFLPSTWFNMGTTDVPGLGIRNQDTSYDFELGGVWIQFRG